jgi:hypothetical protein
VVLSLVALASAPAAAEKIRDNLFLLEEAYNQEPGVIQHIQLLQIDPRNRAWSYSFTEEWPVPTDRHQLSLTLPLQGSPEAGRTGLGDLLVNYRLQLLGLGGEGLLAIAPRLSLLLPTGSPARGSGRGALGVQLNLPASLDLGAHFTLHANAGLTVVPAASSPSGLARATALDSAAGLALVVLPLSWLNLLVEVAHLSTLELRDDGGRERRHALLIQPGVRFALNLRPGGLQIVPGLAAPVTVSAEGTRVPILAYLSLEHRVW